MIGGLFGGKKKSDKDSKSTAQSTPTPSAVSPTSSAADDMFGGLAVAGKSRRKRGATTVDGPPPIEVPPTPTPPAHIDPQTSEAPVHEAPPQKADGQDKPFFAKFQYGADGPIVEEKEPEEEAKLRRRLERFYEEYNPSKLSQIDQTIKSYSGREKELFDALVSKYGPEPNDPAELKHIVHPEHDADEAARSAGQRSQADESAWQAQDDAVSASGWGAPADDGAGQGFNFGDAASTGGFQFESAVTEGASTGFAFASNDEADTAVPVAESSSVGFAFAAPSSEEANTASGFGFATATANEDPGDASASDSDDDAPTLNERHRYELDSAQEKVMAAKSALASAISRIAAAINKRQELVSEYRCIEREIEGCIATEDFDRAEVLNSSLEAKAQCISQQEQVEIGGEAEVPRLAAALADATKSLGDMYAAHRAEVLECKGEEERRVNKYITETSSRLDTQAEKIAASLDRANRTLHNTEQEVINIEQRQQKIQEKIGEQTKGLRRQLTTLNSEKDALDKEIKELELKLQQKRRQNAEKKHQLGELEEKLKIIMDDFTETVDEVSRQLKEETAKRAAAQHVVDEFCSQEESLLREQSQFAEERALMSKGLENNNWKIERYATLADEIKSIVPSEIDAYIQQGFLSVLQARAPGRSFLAQNPHATSPNSSEDEVSPLGALTQLESSLHHLEQELQENQALEASTTVRLQDIRKNLPLLEAAKKAAAQAKQFKEAQAKTAEVKRLMEESAACEEEAITAAKNISRIQEKIAFTTTAIERERRNASAKMASFIGSYKKSLDALSSYLSSTYVNILRVETDEIDEEADELRAALMQLQGTLVEEANALPVFSTTEANEGVDASTEEQQPQPVEEAVEEDAEASDVDEEPPLTREELQIQLDASEAELNAAMDAEDFALCDELQEKIEKLQKLLEGNDE